MALTDRQIKGAKPRKSVYRLRDGNSNLKGFGITIAPAGSKTFFLAYTSPATGKRTQINLGRYPGTNLKQARGLAAIYRNQLMAGSDPKDNGTPAPSPETDKALHPPEASPDEEYENDFEPEFTSRVSRGYERFENQDNDDTDHMSESEPWRSEPSINDNEHDEGREARPTYDHESTRRSTYARAAYAQSSALPETSDSQLNLADFFLKLWIKKGLIFATVLTCMTITAIILFQITPRYSSESLIMIEPRANKIVDVESVVSGLSGDTESIQSEILVILSRNLAQEAIIALKLDKKPEFNTSLAPKGFLASLKENSSGIFSIFPKEWLDAITGDDSGTVAGATEAGPQLKNGLNGNPALQISDKDIFVKGGMRTIDTFLEKMTVKQKGRSRVISVGATSHDPELSAQISNVMADLYLRQLVNQKVDATQQASAWLDKRINVLREQVALAEAAVERYRTKSGLLESRGATVSSLQVAELSTQLIVAKTKTAEARARLEQTKQLLDSPNGILASAEVLKSPFIQKLRETEAEVQHRAAELSNEFGDRHPKMISARAEIIEINAKIEREAAKIVSGMRNEVAIAQARERTMERNLEKIKNEMARANKAEVELRSLEREASASRSLLETFLSRYKETSAQEDQDAQRAGARIISSAGVPQNPAYPKKGIILVLAFIGSFGLGTLLVFLTEILDKGFRSSEQIENLTGVPVFGLIPLLANKSDGVSASAFVVNNPISQFSEALRTVYTSLLLSHVDDPPTKVLITSAQPDEGKTTFTLNLGRMQAMAGRKVLIIEADLRRPGISKLLEFGDKPGLVDLLLGEASLTDVLIEDAISGAFILPAGKPTQNPPTLLSSQMMANAIDELDQKFDLIFFDSPPILAVSDARILATKVDATIFVIRWADTSRDMAAEAVRQLRNSANTLAGIVMTMVDIKKTLKYKYGSSYGYQKRVNKYYNE